MTEDLDIDTYLSISPKKFTIFLFDKKNLKIFYKEELEIQNNFNNINLNILKKFFEKNIFKIEKIVGKFIQNICLVIDNDDIFNLFLGIKKKNYEKDVYKKNLEIVLTDARDLFRENYQDYTIMHMIISKYIVDGKQYEKYIDNFYSENICLEIQFISLSNKFIFEIAKILDIFQIKITQYLDQNYINKILDDKSLELPKKAHTIKNGFNENEIHVIPKNPKKLGFFEKFFQLFS